MWIWSKVKEHKLKWIFRFSVFFTIPIYFVLDGNNKFWGFIPVFNSLVIAAALTVATSFLYLIFKRVADKYIAVILSVWLLLLFLFFKVIKENLLVTTRITLVQQYKYFIPLLFLLTVCLFFLLRKTSVENQGRIVLYLNVLFGILVLIETGNAIIQVAVNKKSNLDTAEIHLQKVVDQQLPNIYFFILDEYVGSTTLKNHFDFSNNEFETSLKQRGFIVPRTPNSNYNYTPFSILSILNMDYIRGITDKELASGIAVNKCIKAISNNHLTSFLASNQYRIVNNSFFRIGTEKYIRKLFLPTEERLLLDKTFGNILWNDLLCTVPSNGFHFFVRDGIARVELYNQSVYKKTVENIGRDKTSKFLYSHFMMPHFPYTRSQDGQLRNLDLVHKESNETRNMKSYVGYLQYCNRVVTGLIDQISKTDPGAIIVLASDHGIRGVSAGDKFFNEFNNLLAVRVPDNNYAGFTDSMGMVNVFRCILRNQFQQEIPLISNQMINVNPGLHRNLLTDSSVSSKELD